MNVIRLKPFRLSRVHPGAYVWEGFHFILDPTTGPQWRNPYVWYVYDDHDSENADLPMWFRGEYAFRSLSDLRQAFVRGWLCAPRARHYRSSLPESEE